MNLQKIRKMLSTPLHIRIRRRHFLIFTVVLILFAGGLVLAGRGLPPPQFVVNGTSGRVAPVDYPLWRKASDLLARQKYAVLTFDDGPYGGGVDESILHILRQHHAHAIFFLVCSHLTNSTDHVLGEIEQDGDLVGNHSYDHPHLNELRPSDLAHQIEGCSTRISELGGKRPRYFRPPFGQTTPGVLHAEQAASMQQVLWDANSEDSWLKRPDQILYWSLEETSNDSILLMHDSPTTAVALDRVLTSLERRGYRFVLPQ